MIISPASTATPTPTLASTTEFASEEETKPVLCNYYTMKLDNAYNWRHERDLISLPWSPRRPENDELPDKWFNQTLKHVSSSIWGINHTFPLAPL